MPATGKVPRPSSQGVVELGASPVVVSGPSRPVFHNNETLRRAMNAGYDFEIHTSSDSQFYAVVRHKNGQVILTTETYTTKQAVRKTLENFTAWLFGAAVESQRGTIEKLIEDHTIDVPGGESV